MPVKLPSPEDIQKLPPDGGPDFNRLIHENSPYLLQHAANPVHWYPWSDAAFAAAREQNKPVFLSIGYATCHWCHVMAHESFEDPAVAAVFNNHFICIKVDREERPDIDHVYMTVTQAISGSGGWPMSVFLTPDRKPFFAGTYFPRKSRYGRPGITDLLERIATLWRDNQNDLLRDAEALTGQLSQIGRNDPGNDTPGEPSAANMDRAYARLAGMFDETYGGFGAAPKFPSPHQMTFLIRYWHRTGKDRALTMAEETLGAMRRGGIFDHIGFGFHRYSTDRAWLVPHFEKMLYDQAMLALAYIEAFQATGNDCYASAARDILTYVLRDMTSPSGGFYSAEDADSEGEEGRFYLWDPAEVKSVLGVDDGDMFCRLFNIRDGGNFRDEATGEKSRRSIPHLTMVPEDLSVAATFGMAPDDFLQWIERMRNKLFRHREQRIHPMKDDKILTDWNGLMIAAMARAGRALQDDEYTQAAVRAADFVLTHLRDDDGRLLKRYRNGDAAFPAHLDDYAFMIRGLLELYESGFQSRYLREARLLTDQAMARFGDSEGGGFYLTAEDGETLLFRDKPAYDGAIPSGNSIMAMNLIRLYRMLDAPEYLSAAEALFKALAGPVQRGPSAFCQMLQAVGEAASPPETIVIAGVPNRRDTREMIAAVRKGYHPNRVVLFRPDSEDPGDSLPEISELAPRTADQRMVGGKATAYVCRDFTCRPPVTDPSLIRRGDKGTRGDVGADGAR